MHIRTLTKVGPAPARSIEEILDIVTYFLTIINQIKSLIAGLKDQ